MKTNVNIKSSLMQRTGLVALVALATFAGLPVNAATSFPDYPLLTGTSSIPPNILLILDDSGSMQEAWMPANSSLPPDKYVTGHQNYDLDDNAQDRSYFSNSLYYDPSKTYLPWRTKSTTLTDRLANADFKSVASDRTDTTSSKINLIDSTESFFYVPKVANPGTTTSNYDKYRVGSSSASGSYSGGAVQKYKVASGPSGSGLAASNNGWSSCIAISVGTAESITITTSGNIRADPYVYNSNSNCNSHGTTGRLVYDSGSGNPKSVDVDSPPTTVYLVIKGDGGAVSGITYSTSIASWEDALPPISPRTTQQAELQNIANWYQYHRTRNKMAKAGASEAFGRLGKNYRVGFDTIHNKGGSSSNAGGSVPAYPIPYNKNGGLFEDSGTSAANRTDFYTMLQAADANNSGTPLHGALQRAARYFGTNDPWKTGSTTLTCRQNYAILTTDGYWNYNLGYSSVGNADNVSGWSYRDSYSNTLADVAYKYWSEDLRTDMEDNVRSSAADGNNTKQHMVTFGVSIGLEGTLDQDNPAPSPWNVDPGAPTSGTTGGDAKRIDDLWHAAINGHGSFIVAKNTDAFASALANALNAIDARSASGSNIASSSTKTDTSTYTFVAGFTSITWLGDMIASPFNAALTGVSTTALWTLSKTFGAGGVNQTFSDRKILTSKGDVAAEFKYTATGGMSNQSDFAARTGQADQVTAEESINYLRGVQAKEVGKTNGTLRKREWPIGDIVDSSPAYIADTNTVYIGANDGMLHGIDASTGKVVFSYVPKGIDYSALVTLSSPTYDHRYFVDGQIEVVSKAVQGNGKNILVGALGRGGRGVFALDVTTPTSMSIANVLWDNTTQEATTERDMGYVLGAVRIRKGNGDKLYAFVPNGIESPNGSSTLFVYELNATGGITSTTKLVADSSGGNGLMGLGLADINSDGKVDYVYGGDLKGNVWRWNFTGNTPPAAATKLFQAKDSANNPQPITGGLGVGRDTGTGTMMVGFGTGRFISSSDTPGVATQTTQTMYGLVDDLVDSTTATTITGRTQLQQRTIPFTGVTASGEVARGFETYSPLAAGKKGWYIDLAAPERVISAPTVYGTAMFLSSVIPASSSSDCNGVSGSGFLNAINLFTGTSPQSGGYFNETWTTTGGGILGSVGVSGGMPTEVNVTNALATVGTGAFSSDGTGNTTSKGIVTPAGGTPQRINWREIVPLQ